MMWEMEPCNETFEHAMSRNEQYLVKQGEAVQILKFSTIDSISESFPLSKTLLERVSPCQESTWKQVNFGTLDFYSFADCVPVGASHCPLSSGWL